MLQCLATVTDARHGLVEAMAARDQAHTSTYESRATAIAATPDDCTALRPWATREQALSPAPGRDGR